MSNLREINEVLNKRHLFFSLEAARKGSSVSIWRREDGTEVEVTVVLDSRQEGEERYTWEDKIYLGVGSYVRQSEVYYGSAFSFLNDNEGGGFIQ